MSHLDPETIGFIDVLFFLGQFVAVMILYLEKRNRKEQK